jgi:hypothetical protein
MKTKIALFILSLAFGLTACGEHIEGNGNVAEVTHQVSDFEEISISGVFEVELIPGGSYVEVITDENLHEHINVSVEDGELHIDTDDKMLEAETLKLRIAYEHLEEIEVAGAVHLYSSKPILSDRFEFEVAGACDADLLVQVDELEMAIKGGGEINVGGSCDRAVFEISGAGDIDAFELNAEEVEVAIMGAGDVKVNATDQLEVVIRGAGDVLYKGDPEVEKDITGAGSVKKA